MNNFNTRVTLLLQATIGIIIIRGIEKWACKRVSKLRAIQQFCRPERNTLSSKDPNAVGEWLIHGRRKSNRSTRADEFPWN